ncbi:MAG: DUF3604 domain-containing protein, partial [Nitrospinota bacterium]
TAGPRGVDEGGALRVATHQMADWGVPQWEDPAGENFCSAEVHGRGGRGGARVALEYDPHDGVRPWRRTLTARVVDGPLFEGDQLLLHLGDTSGGSPGLRVQSFDLDPAEFRPGVDIWGTGLFLPLPALRVTVRGGPAARIVAVAPSEMVVEEVGEVTVRVEDIWGNLSFGHIGTVYAYASSSEVINPEAHTFGGEGPALARLPGLSFHAPGLYRLEVRDELNGLSCETNPVRAREAASTAGSPRPPHRLFWGDLHAGQTGSTVGSGTVPDFYAFARDVGRLAFCAHQGNCFQVSREDFEELRRHTCAFHEPGRFVPFLGYEWSGTTAMGGDRAVVFLGEDAPLHRASHVQLEDLGDLATDRDHIRKLQATVRELARSGLRSLLLPHVGGRPFDPDTLSPEVEPFVEVYSVHGMFEWAVEEVMRRGLRMGFTCGGDDHLGHPGASRPGLTGFQCKSGLTAVLAEELTREALWEAFLSRRAYGTTGERILLDLSIAGSPMGGEAEVAEEVEVRLWAAGTGPIESVELFRGLEVVAAEQPTPPDSTGKLRILFSGARTRGRARRASWDGELRVSGGELLGAQAVAFLEPPDRLFPPEGRRLAWQASTAGERKGLIIEVEPAGARVEVEAGPVRFEFAVGEVLAAPRGVAAGGVGLQVEVGRAPAPGGPREVELLFVDRPPPGLHGYFVRLTQVDQGRAWTSPVWVRRR